VTEAVREAIEAGDVDALSALVGADPTLAEADVAFGPGGRNRVPPLHYVCDVVFRRLPGREASVELANVLLEAGVDPDRAYARSGDTYLIAAASLGAEEVGLRLVELGADVRPRGLFGATALHWAAHMGLERLAAALLDAGAELELADARYGCTPLEWTLHAWSERGAGRREGLPIVARLLRERGARVPPEATASLDGEADAPMRRALEAAPE